MSEISITKRCCHCKEIKPVSEFGRNRSTKDGYQLHCTPCRKIFNAAYNKTDKRKKVLARHAQTSNFKATQLKYQQSPKGRLMQENVRNRYPEKLKAREKVNTAVTAGKLPRPDTLKCKYCPEQAEEYHHTHGYLPEHWLDVEPTCIKCHKFIHKQP